MKSRKWMIDRVRIAVFLLGPDGKLTRPWLAFRIDPEGAVHSWRLLSRPDEIKLAHLRFSGVTCP